MNRNFQSVFSRGLGLATLSVVTMAMAFSSCNSSSESPQPQKKTQSQGANSPAWIVSLKNACEGVTDNTCQGQYGFSVDANGAYKVGPAPGGEVLTGQLTADQFAAVSAKVTALGNFAAEASVQENCVAVEDDDTGAIAPGAGDTLTLTEQGDAHVLLLAKQNQSCTEVGNAASVADLHSVMSTLESAYYPAAFPDACTDSIALLIQQYASVQGCATDKDCSYYNVNLGAGSPSFDPATDGAVFTDSIYGSCTVIKPLVVANTALLNAGSDALAKQIVSTLNACQSREPADCTTATIDASQPPRCVQNVCKPADSQQGSAALMALHFR